MSFLEKMFGCFHSWSKWQLIGGGGSGYQSSYVKTARTCSKCGKVDTDTERVRVSVKPRPQDVSVAPPEMPDKK
jgi:hypothetical protein